jgi:hypothetical protein
MNEHDAMAWAEEKGLEYGARIAPYSPPLVPGLFPDADDAYCSAYWDAFAYAGITRDRL